MRPTSLASLPPLLLLLLAWPRGGSADDSLTSFLAARDLATYLNFSEAPPPLTLQTLIESEQLVMASLKALFESEAGQALKPVIGRVYQAFERAIELTKVFSAVKDHAGFFELLTTMVSQVKALTPGSSIVVPGGFKGGLLLYVLHMDTFDECTLAICASGEGLEGRCLRM